MTAPYYFLPNMSKRHLVGPNRKFVRSILAERGLDKVMRDIDSDKEAPCFDLPNSGPGGKAGCILYLIPSGGTVPARYGYKPDLQDWSASNEDTLWIGLDREEPPTPEDLARKDLIDGYRIPLGNHTWQVPIVRTPREGFSGTLLPRHLDWTGGGVDEGDVIDDYRELWEESAVVYEAINGGEPVPDVRLQLFAFNCLAVNYRFGPAVQRALQVLNKQLCQLLIYYALDMPKVDEDQKKTSPDTPSTSPGSTDSDPTTEPAAANSSQQPSTTGI